MMLLDANLLIYAIDADSAHHERVRPWWEELLSGPGEVGLPWIVILAFVRNVPGVSLVDTSPAVYPQLAAGLRVSGTHGCLPGGSGT